MSNRLGTSALVNADGSPMLPVKSARIPAYHAADFTGQDLAGWHPGLASADMDLLYERDAITARIRDMARNDGWASGIVSSELDNVIGSGLRLSAKPDWRALNQTREWAHDWGTRAEALWRTYANDPGKYCDASRHSQMGGVFGLGYRHYLQDGDALATLLWKPGRGGKWATAVRVIDPDRLSNPLSQMDSDHIRGGVEIDEDTAAIAYYIRKRHPADIPSASMNSFVWERVPRETAWGRPVIVHFYDKTRDGQTRGVGRLTPILEKLKMVSKASKVELQAAVLNSIFAAFIESPFDHELLTEILEEGNGAKINGYQDARAAFHAQRQVSLNGIRIPTLFPGDKFSFQTAARPNVAFVEFERAMLRNIAAGTGLSYEQISRDWSQSNYSSARGALLETWKTLITRRRAFAASFATPIYGAFLEEAIDRGELEEPAGAPSFYDARAAYCHCQWIGPGRGWVDPVKEKQGALIGINGAMSTLEAECAEQGVDYQEVIEQIGREIAELPNGVLHPAQRDWAQYIRMQGGQQEEEGQKA
ncbi:phage portal protein [Dongia soli]|uniref:Phage portal protein n=1 Tax=Dongia soli TaxID=600628 RepID=A0ABU5E7J7_9PROT|nr:phage portal protein [Dongia soli]MDY0882297.1 phage portal protein [Dongia soli]